MGIPEIDQIKKAEQDAVDLIEMARHRKDLAIEEAKRAGVDLIAYRLSDADKRIRAEKEQAEHEMSEDRARLMKEAEEQARSLQFLAMEHKNTAVLHLVRMVTGDNHVLSGPNE